MTVVDVTGGVLESCWQETETVVKSSFLDLVQLVGQEGVSEIKIHKYYIMRRMLKEQPLSFILLIS